jgi:hypothetical protein
MSITGMQGCKKLLMSALQDVARKRRVARKRAFARKRGLMRKSTRERPERRPSQALINGDAASAQPATSSALGNICSPWFFLNRSPTWRLACPATPYLYVSPFFGHCSL